MAYIKKGIPQGTADENSSRNMSSNEGPVRMKIVEGGGGGGEGLDTC